MYINMNNYMYTYVYRRLSITVPLQKPYIQKQYVYKKKINLNEYMNIYMHKYIIVFSYIAIYLYICIHTSIHTNIRITMCIYQYLY
jgi:hypothetical protein